MAQLTPQQIGITGLGAAYSAVNASDTCNPDDRVFLHVKNGNASADTVTIVTPGNGPGGIAVPDIPVTVPATNGERFVGPLNAALADPTTGLVTITHSVTATVTAALVRI